MLSIKKVDWTFFKKALKVISPVVLSQVIVVAISFVDSLMVNNYDRVGQPTKVDYAAVGISGEIFFAFESFLVATSVVFGILYAQFVNRKKLWIDTAKLNFWFSLVISVFISLIMFLAASPLVNSFFIGSPGKYAEFVKPIAIDYLKIMSLGQFFLSIGWAILNPLVTKGKTRYTLYVTLVSLFLNFLLDYLFIYVMNLGAQGSAWATVTCYIVQLIISLFFLKKHWNWFEGMFKDVFNLNKFVVKEVFKRSFIFFSFILMQFGFAFATTIYLNLYTADNIKPMAVAYTISSIMFTVMSGINRGVKIFIGPLLGDDKFDEAKIVAKKLLWPNLFLTVIFVIGSLISTIFFPKIMLDNQNEIDLARTMIFTFAGILIVYVLLSYYSAILETSGAQLIPNICNYFFQVWAVIPATVLMSHVWLDLSFELNFIISQLIYIPPAIVVYYNYRKMNWLKRIKE